MGKEKTSIYIDPYDMHKIRIPVNTSTEFSVIMQRLNIQFAEIMKTLEELRECEVCVTITAEKDEN